MFEILNETTRWFEEAVPSPTSKNQHTQLGVHFEEVAEMIGELKGVTVHAHVALMRAKIAVQELAVILKSRDNEVTIPDPHNFLKEMCDQIVTATGVAHMYGYDIVGAMEEVNSSNWSKFVEGKPVFDQNQKIIKGPDYYKADLSAYIVA